MIVTCDNTECENYGVAIDVQPPLDDDGVIDAGWLGVECGPCGTTLHEHDPSAGAANALAHLDNHRDDTT